MCHSLSFNKGGPATWLTPLAQVFSCEFCEISKNTFFCRTPPVTASQVFTVKNEYLFLLPWYSWSALNSIDFANTLFFFDKNNFIRTQASYLTKS